MRAADIRVPFNRPHRTGQETALLASALRDGVLTGNGPFTQMAAGLLSPLVGGAPCLLTPSCTHALEMAALLLNLGPGDEVIMPSFTFVSTANAFVLRGAVPVFVDIRPDTFNLDAAQVDTAITQRTRAIVAVHYGGVACEMERLSTIATQHGLFLIEDNAHGLGGRYRGEALGSIGALGAQSFHSTKNVQCGEGGALVVNDRGLLDRAEVLREKGTDRTRFDRGETDRYTWVDIGSSYVLSDMLAAILATQLDEFDVIQAGRRRVWSAYDERLHGWRAEHGVRAQHVPPECDDPAHLYALVMPSAPERDALITHLAARGILAAFHYVPLDSSPGGRRHARVGPGGCDVTADVAARLVRLPLYSQMTDDELEQVLEAVMDYYPSESSRSPAS